MMSPDERASWAGQLRDNRLLGVLLDDMRKDCLETWVASTSMAQREEQWHRYQATLDFEKRVQRVFDDNKLAAARARRVSQAAQGQGPVST